MRVTPHLVFPDAAEAGAWYGVASEFRQAGILSPLSIGGTATVLHINTEDVDTLWDQAIAVGATVHHQLGDQFWGERQGQLTDPFGHRWNIAQHLRDVPEEEIAAAAARAFKT
jgi:PhnB protein